MPARLVSFRATIPTKTMKAQNFPLFAYETSDSGTKLHAAGGAHVATVHDASAVSLLSRAPAMLAALKVIVLTPVTQAFLIENDPQALKQILACVTLGDLDDGQGETLAPAVRAIRKLS
jgi:hypothetical protein